MSYMFSGCRSLDTIRLGLNFSFTGNNSTSNTLLPHEYWYTADGTRYATEEIPNNVAATYYAVKP